MSTLKVNSIEPANSGSEDYFLARAWVNFNGTGTVAIRADGNVSSITDNGTGDYTANFSSAVSSANYSAVFGGANLSGTAVRAVAGDANYSQTTSAIRTQSFASSAKVDFAYVSIGIIL